MDVSPASPHSDEEEDEGQRLDQPLRTPVTAAAVSRFPLCTPYPPIPLLHSDLACMNSYELV